MANTSGTQDTDAFSPYKTSLAFPNLMNDSEIIWKAFYRQKEKIGESFCIPNYYPFKKPFYLKHKTDCDFDKSSNRGRYLRTFTGFNDPLFKEWIEDAYAPLVMLNTFEQLAREYSLSVVFPSIIKSELDMSDPRNIGRALWNLYHYQPK